MADSTVSSDLTVHRLIFNEEIDGLRQYLSKLDFDELRKRLDEQDSHGNTPLHLACILGCTESIKLLIEYGASTRVNNKYKCSPVHEAVSFRNRKNLLLVLKAATEEIKPLFSKELIHTCLGKLPDFSFKVTWQLKTWIPFISNFLPSDVCTIWKKGDKIRVDSSIGDIDSLMTSFFAKPKDGVSLILDVSGEELQTYLVNHAQRSYRSIVDQDDEVEERDVNAWMCTEIHAFRLDLKNIRIEPCYSGIFSRQEKTVTLNGLPCKCLIISNIEGHVLTRTEHITEEVRRHTENWRMRFSEKSKHVDGNFSLKKEIKEFENSLQEIVDKYDPLHGERLKPNITFEKYQLAENCFTALGRTMRLEVSKRVFTVETALANEFRLRPADFIDVLGCFVTLKQFQRLRQVCDLLTPYGFPFRVEVPLYHMVKATVTFGDFDFESEMPDSIFDIPANYVKLETTKQ